MFRTVTALVCAPAFFLAACGNRDGADQGAAGNRPASGSIEEAPAVPLVGPEGTILGNVHGGDSSEGAVLRIEAKGLPPGVHAMHIHDAGQCEGQSFESAGPHWNPTNKQHGLQNAAGPHRGDLPNVTVGEDGRLVANLTIQGSHLKPSRANGTANVMLDENGAALVIHAQGDDHRTDPSGNSGERIACAVLAGP